jgi:hypothetical protein
MSLLQVRRGGGVCLRAHVGLSHSVTMLSGHTHQ